MNFAVIFAGGMGGRMNNAECPKQFLDLCGKPVIIRTLEPFEENPRIDGIVVSCVKNYIGHLRDLLKEYGIDKVRKIVPGGATGQLSIYKGLLAAKELEKGEPSVVLIHDGVRPFIDSALITKNIKAVEKYGSSVTVGSITETVLTAGDDGFATGIFDRKALRTARAPQGFWLDEILSAHEEVLENGRNDYIDSCTMMQDFGKHLYLIEGPADNIKITTKEDFYLAQVLIRRGKEGVL